MPRCLATRARIVLAQVGVSPTTSDEGARPRAAYLDCPSLYHVHPICPAPGAPSLWGGHPVAHHHPLRSPPKPVEERAPSQAHTLSDSYIEGTERPVQAPALEHDSPRAPHSRILDSACPERSLPSRQTQGASFQRLAFEHTYPSLIPLKGLRGAHELKH